MKINLHFVFLICLVASVASFAASDATDEYEDEKGSASTNDQFAVRPALRMESLSQSKREKLEAIKNIQGKRPGGLVSDVVSILTETNENQAVSRRKVTPEYNLSRNDIIDLFGIPSNVRTNRYGREVLAFEVLIDDPFTSNMTLIIEIDDDRVHSIAIAREL